MSHEDSIAKKNQTLIWYPLDLNWDQGQFDLGQTTRQRLRKLCFLDGRYHVPVSDHHKSVSFSEALGQEQKSYADPTFLFHTGFCGSTLLAKCLDQKGVCLSLKEPRVLTTLAGVKPIVEGPFLHSRFEKALAGTFRLIQKSQTGKETLVIKCSNYDNTLLPDILDFYPNAKFIFLAPDLKSFLLSVIKGGEPRQTFIKRLWMNFTNISKTFDGFPKLTDLENPETLKIAALVWKWQTDLFEMPSFGATKKIFEDRFFADPIAVLRDLEDFLNIPARSDKDYEAVLKFHAKVPELAFSTQKRKQELRAVEMYFAPEVEKILAWSEETFPPVKKNPEQKIAV